MSRDLLRDLAVLNRLLAMTLTTSQNGLETPRGPSNIHAY